MSLPTYDEFRDRYVDDLDAAVGFSGKDHAFFTRRKATELLELAERHVAAAHTLNVLDVGCGIGLTDAFLAGRVARLTGVDVGPGVLERAAARNPDVHYELSDGENLPFGDGIFDVTFCASVVQVLPPERRVVFLDELRRVTSDRGMVVVFEHNPYNPLTRVVVRRFSHGHDVHMLPARQLVDLAERAGLAVLERAHILLLPSESRAAQTLERRLERLPLGAQYVVAARPARA
jgi:ubiquinone/menaquinone biosynthesis C-methylase UbiE